MWKRFLQAVKYHAVLLSTTLWENSSSTCHQGHTLSVVVDLSIAIGIISRFDTNEICHEDVSNLTVMVAIDPFSS